MYLVHVAAPSSQVQRFDRFSDGGGACFHPAGNEVVINSEVWDLRSDRLLRSVPALDGTQLSWRGMVHTPAIRVFSHGSSQGFGGWVLSCVEVSEGNRW